MKNITKLAIAIIFVGLVGLAVGIITKFGGPGIAIAGFSPSGWGQFTAICFLLSINLLLLDKKT